MAEEKKINSNNDEEQEKNQEQVKTDVSAQLAQKDEEIRGYIDRLKRLQAEFENYKKRVLRDMASLEERVSDREILDFLPLYDNLERAFASYNGNNDAQSFIEGIERIFAQFDQILKQKGIVPIDAEGTLFDPTKHEALLSVESDKEKNVILEEFERGYMRNGRVLRPSKVKVSKGIKATKEEQNGGES